MEKFEMGSMFWYNPALEIKTVKLKNNIIQRTKKNKIVLWKDSNFKLLPNCLWNDQIKFKQKREAPHSLFFYILCAPRF